MTENNLLARIRRSPVHVRKIILFLSTSALMAIIVGTWLLTLSSDNNNLAKKTSEQPSSAFALFENGFFRKEVRYTR